MNPKVTRNEDTRQLEEIRLRKIRGGRLTDLIPLGINEAFYDDHVKEISSGSTTTHSDSSLYDSFIFDLLINPFPPADRSDFYEFADELAHTDLIPLGINEAFYDDHVKEISSGGTITHSDSSLYDSFIFDLSINPFPPADRIIISLLSCQMYLIKVEFSQNSKS
nr:hypothetical protein [Tanacetum cinerariifolium]